MRLSAEQRHVLELLASDRRDASKEALVFVQQSIAIRLPTSSAPGSQQRNELRIGGANGQNVYRRIKR
jgi:hypothetical protein